MLLTSVLSVLIWTTVGIAALIAAVENTNLCNKQLAVKLLTLSAMAYSNDPELCLKKVMRTDKQRVMDGFEMKVPLRVMLDKKSHTLAAFIGLTHTEKKL